MTDKLTQRGVRVCITYLEVERHAVEEEAYLPSAGAPFGVHHVLQLLDSHLLVHPVIYIPKTHTALCAACTCVVWLVSGQRT